MFTSPVYNTNTLCQAYTSTNMPAVLKLSSDSKGINTLTGYVLTQDSNGITTRYDKYAYAHAYFVLTAG